MKTKNVIILIMLISIITQAQSIEKFSIDSGGASVVAGGIEVLYTIGEVNVQEYSQATVSVSEGFINPEVQVAIKINPIAFIQGASINPVSGEETLMRDDLRTSSLIPTTSPYLDVLTCNSSVFSTIGTNAIVDWVWVELRAENDNTNIVSSQSALLQRDGDVVDVDGTSPLTFDLVNGNYFVAISHRNHLGIITANTVALSAVTTVLDFSIGITVVNGGSNAVVDLGNGIFAMYSGDYDGNGQVQNTDLTSITPLLGQPSSYDNADLDMNTQVQNTDINNLLNPNKGRGQQFTRLEDLKLFAKRKK